MKILLAMSVIGNTFYDYIILFFIYVAVVEYILVYRYTLHEFLIKVFLVIFVLNILALTVSLDEIEMTDNTRTSVL